MDAAAGPVAGVSAEVAGIEAALKEIAYLASRARQHERMMAVAGLDLDRSAAALLRSLSEHEPVRSGELANRLAVEASHITRQVQQLERTGYVTRVPDPDDGRAQLVELTPRGRAAVERIRVVGCLGMQQALADWPAEDIGTLAVLFRRMVDDFVAHADDEIAFEVPDAS
ncbi:MarR family transcriptional regulator [Actinospica sp. MGRD01-02]|uniref:MarR family transcriptional regulator n=1 Tax=Actinospica acidithermotolerans TaxID=2828514 RepID=A0A941EEL6_9ACTN|nr:MarR family transcriptional regulator [Actinospica acidithermotolerans]MBR7829268.1 MarR family transcriptional regulator [Actinospica acidithermotolerans]